MAARLQFILIILLMTGDVTGAVHDVQHVGGDHVSLTCDGCSPAAESLISTDVRSGLNWLREGAQVVFSVSPAAYSSTLVWGRSPRAPPLSP